MCGLLLGRRTATSGHGMLSQWTPLTIQLTRARVLQHVAQAGGGFRLEPKWPHSLSLSALLSLSVSVVLYLYPYLYLSLSLFFLSARLRGRPCDPQAICVYLSLSVSQRGRHASLRWLAAGFPMIDDARKF